jgi:hypothetical protein
MGSLELFSVRGSFTPEVVAFVTGSRHADTLLSLALHSPNIDSHILEEIARSRLADHLVILHVNKYSGQPPSSPLMFRALKTLHLEESRLRHQDILALRRKVFGLNTLVDAIGSSNWAYEMVIPDYLLAQTQTEAERNREP